MKNNPPAPNEAADIQLDWSLSRDSWTPDSPAIATSLPSLNNETITFTNRSLQLRSCINQLSSLTLRIHENADWKRNRRHA